MNRQSESLIASKSASPTRGLVGALLTLAVLVVAYGLFEVHSEVQRTETARVDQAQALSLEIESVHAELLDIRTELVSTHEEATAASLLSLRLRSAEDRLGAIGATIEAQTSSLTVLEKEREDFGPQTLERELNERDGRLLRSWEALSDLASTAKESADESRRQIEQLDAQLDDERDLRRMWRELVGPVVQLAGETSIGSGVLLQSIEQEEGGFRTYLVTAWHVVRDIQGDLSKTDMPVPVNIYAEDGSIRRETAQLLCFDPEIDAALLELHTPAALDNGAAMASHERLADVRIFDTVYAVGCPLGNDPIPTGGEIATTQHEVEGENYWMINAPTYIGNSGGGIFDSETHELLGHFSKIYTHGTLRPTIVPHMGLVTPMSQIYSWLEDQGYDLVNNQPKGSSKVAVAD
jgi:hypothetical protein